MQLTAARNPPAARAVSAQVRPASCSLLLAPFAPARRLEKEFAGTTPVPESTMERPQGLTIEQPVHAHVAPLGRSGMRPASIDRCRARSPKHYGASRTSFSWASPLS